MAKSTWISRHVCGRYFDYVPCSPVGPKENLAALPLSSHMYLFRIRSKSQKQSSRSQDSNSASNSSSRPPLLPQTNRALSIPDDTSPSSSSSSLANNLDISPSKRQIGRKISYRESDEPKWVSLLNSLYSIQPYIFSDPRSSPIYRLPKGRLKTCLMPITLICTRRMI